MKRHVTEAHTDDDDIIEPATTADVDETPRFVRYGAAILLGLAFGVGCYIWVDGIPSAPQRNDRVKAAPTEQYFTQMGLYDNPNAKGTIPDPFVSPFEPTLGSDNSDATYYSETTITDNPATSTTGRTEYVAINPVGSKLIYLFKYDSDNVPENPELTAMARVAKHKGLSLDVKAYTDEHGRAVYNQRLSERRAPRHWRLSCRTWSTGFKSICPRHGCYTCIRQRCPGPTSRSCGRKTVEYYMT